VVNPVAIYRYDVDYLTEDSRNIFFPIDGFSGQNRVSVLAARDELAELLQLFFGGCQVGTGLVI
jgi:hypothetical protein